MCFILQYLLGLWIAGHVAIRFNPTIRYNDSRIEPRILCAQIIGIWCDKVAKIHMWTVTHNTGMLNIRCIPVTYQLLLTKDALYAYNICHIISLQITPHNFVCERCIVVSCTYCHHVYNKTIKIAIQRSRQSRIRILDFQPELEYIRVLEYSPQP